jgi:histidinol-phosphatase (PHP family)
MLIDCHMHTPLCGHAQGHPREYVRAAASKGIGLLTFTCHAPTGRHELFRGPGIRMCREELPEYERLVAEAVDEGRALGVEVLRGIEAEVFPEAAALEQMDEVLAEGGFDFVLGSLHHPLPGYRAWLRDHAVRDEREIVDTYFRHLAEGVRSGRYDSMAHPDVIRIYGTVQRFEPGEHQPAITAFLDALVDTGTCMEVNTSGLIKGVYKLHPDPLILQWAQERGVCLTLGSDAHAPEQVGQHFDMVLKLLRSIGFRELNYFRGRRRHSIAL